MSAWTRLRRADEYDGFLSALKRYGSVNSVQTYNWHMERLYETKVDLHQIVFSVLGQMGKLSVQNVDNHKKVL